MLAIAVMGDLLSLIPGVNIISNIITAAALFIVSGESHVKLYSHDYIGGTLATIVAETVPGISMLPLWTVRVLLAKRQATNE